MTVALVGSLTAGALNPATLTATLSVEAQLAANLTSALSLQAQAALGAPPSACSSLRCSRRRPR